MGNDLSKQETSSASRNSRKFLNFLRNSQDFRSRGRIEGTPQYWINKIKVEPSVDVLKDLQAVLASETLAWVRDFVESGGLGAILDLLGEVEHNLHQKAQTRQLKCV